MDSDATNFDSLAEVDDGTCVYPQTDPDGPCVGICGTGDDSTAGENGVGTNTILITVASFILAIIFIGALIMNVAKKGDEEYVSELEVSNAIAENSDARVPELPPVGPPPGGL